VALLAEVLKQIDAVLSKHRELRSRSQYEDCSDQPDVETTGLTALMCETINRLSPPNSHYFESMKSIVKRSNVDNA
jgi:hypothetical protein